MESQDVSRILLSHSPLAVILWGVNTSISLVSVLNRCLKSITSKHCKPLLLFSAAARLCVCPDSVYLLMHLPDKFKRPQCN